MIIAIVGPTGVGKTQLSLALAQKYQAIIINCDAVQIYKGLDIGSAKIKPSEMDGIPHFLIDIKNPDEDYSVADYQKDFRQIIAQNPDKNIIIVGGTGLYLTAAINDYQFGMQKNIDYMGYTNAELYDLALAQDPNCKITPNNRIRLINFLKRTTNPSIAKPLYDVKIIGLTQERSLIYERINDRVKQMLDEGLVAEVKELYQKYPDSKVLHRAIGYKEIISYLNNEITLAEAIRKIQQNSRHYAKRQYTWFKHKNNVKWFPVDYEEFANTIDNVIKYIEGVDDEKNK